MKKHAPRYVVRSDKADRDRVDDLVSRLRNIHLSVSRSGVQLTDIERVGVARIRAAERFRLLAKSDTYGLGSFGKHPRLAFFCLFAVCWCGYWLSDLVVDDLSGLHGGSYPSVRELRVCSLPRCIPVGIDDELRKLATRIPTGGYIEWTEEQDF